MRTPYVDPNSGVLRNLLGITDAEDLAAAEADFTSIRLAQLALVRVEKSSQGIWKPVTIPDYYVQIVRTVP